MRTYRTWLLLALLGLATVTSTGCYPFSMGIFTPIPVPAWVNERMEEKYCHKNDFRTPIMPPIREDFPPPMCLDPPDPAMVLRAMRHIKRGVPFICEEFRDDIEIVPERLVDKIDPPRFYPLIGLAQLHHCHWKCTIYFTEVLQSDYPFPYKCRRPAVEVVYIDKDHLHLYPCTTPEGQRQITRDLIGR